jgi:DNA modification methylase
MTALQLTYLPVTALIPLERNARTHSPKQIRQIADNIRRFGFTNPVLIDQEGHIIAGHGRVAAARMLAMEQVATVRLEHLSEHERRAYILADNRLAELAGWDREILAIEFQYLSSLELDFSVEITGFDQAEIEILMEEFAETDGDEDEALPELPELAATVSRPGELWELGEHRLLCADALEASAYAHLMGSDTATIVFTDPPYNVPIEGHVTGLGKQKHPEFAMACGEMSEAEFTTFLTTVLTHLARHSVDGSLQYVCMDWRHLYELLSAGRVVYREFKQLCVWNKDNGGMGSLYRSKHELVLVFKCGNAPHINNVQLGKFGRYRTNVWDYPGMSSVGPSRDAALALHPTVKPVALIADALRDASHRGDIVLDPFGGAGSTLLAAERTQRRARLIEIDPRYIDVTIRRWQERTGRKAVLSGTERTFDDVTAERSLHTCDTEGHGHE